MRELLLKQHPPNPESFFFAPGDADTRPEICSGALKEHVNIPDGTRQIAIVTTKRPRADSFDIRKDGRIGGIPNYLDCDFQKWLRSSYRAGLRYGHVEIVS